MATIGLDKLYYAPITEATAASSGVQIGDGAIIGANSVQYIPTYFIACPLRSLCSHGLIQQCGVFLRMFMKELTVPHVGEHPFGHGRKIFFSSAAPFSG